MRYTDEELIARANEQEFKEWYKLENTDYEGFNKYMDGE